MQEVDANLVIEALLRQNADLSRRLAIAEAMLAQATVRPNGEEPS